MKSLLALAAFFVLASTAFCQAPKDALLVVTKQTHALAVVDASTLKVIAHIPIGEDPHEVVVAPDNRTAFVSNYGEGTLHTMAHVDLVAHKALAPIDITPLVGAHGMYRHDSMIWFTAEGSESLGTLDPATGRVIGVLGVGQNKTHLVWVSRDGKKIVASNAGSRTMSIFDRFEIKPAAVPGAPAMLASYTHASWQHTLVPVGPAAEGFAVSPDEHEAWVGNADGTISILNLQTEKVEQTLQAGIVGANRLAFTPDGRMIVITAHTGKDLVVFDAHTRKLIKRVPIEQRGASGIQMDPDGSRVFVACPRDHYVAVIDLHSLTMTGKIDAGREPDGMTWWHR